MDCLQLRICGTPSQHARAEHTSEEEVCLHSPRTLYSFVTGSVSVRAVAITLMEFSPGMPEDHSARCAPGEVNLAEHFVHLCDIQHHRVSSPNGNAAASRRRRSLLPLAMVPQTCDGRCTITTSNSIWADTDDRLDGRTVRVQCPSGASLKGHKAGVANLEQTTIIREAEDHYPDPPHDQVGKPQSKRTSISVDKPTPPLAAAAPTDEPFRHFRASPSDRPPPPPPFMRRPKIVWV